jgi:cytochrome subunit of sulfide dehydrogenase
MRTSQKIATALLAALGAAASTSAPAADPMAGRLLASQCAQCHGTDGHAVSGFESLAGESVEEIIKEFREMRADTTPDIMDLQARGYTDEQVRLIAEFFAAQPRSGSDHD